MGKLKALYYMNQFYAGIGAEVMADIDLTIHEDKRGPALGIERYWDGEMEVVKVISCGDNFVNNEENYEGIKPQIDRIIDEIKPDVFIAGPAFNAGRYGVACAKLCDYVKNKKGVPSVTAMYYENPAAALYVKDNYIVESSETAAGMRKTLPRLASLALKLAKKEKINASRFEGYIPTGHRYNEYHEKAGAQRVVEILLKKLQGNKYITEVPLRGFEQVQPSEPVEDLKKAAIALVTTGGLVPKGNPDKLKQAFSVTYGKYDISQLNTIPSGDYVSIHGGYDTTTIDKDPNRLVPLDELRELEKDGMIHEIYRAFFSTCGVGTNVENSKDIGRRIAKELLKERVQAAILTST